MDGGHPPNSELLEDAVRPELLTHGISTLNEFVDE
jgi:hypothetical protein